MAECVPFIIEGTKSLENAMNAVISKFDKIGKILSRDEFKGFSRFIIPEPPGLIGLLMRYVQLTTICRFGKTWNSDDVVDGLNRIISLVRAGERVHYDLWCEVDQEKEPRKRDTGLLHFPVSQKKPFILVCAGGAYQTVASYLEAFPVATEVNLLGYSAFVLHYRTGKDNPWPAPLEDLQHALQFILNNADDLNVEREGFAVAGFSAGGHLVASLGTTNFGYQYLDLPKPGALLLGYPVTIWENMSRIHKHCRNIILDKQPTQAEVDKITILLHVDGNFPPTYIMHCQDDDIVHFENAERLAKVLEVLDVPYYLQAVPTGGHGIGLANGTPAEGWVKDAVQFWQAQC
jgi:acetyl esterase/lipase